MKHVAYRILMVVITVACAVALVVGTPAQQWESPPDIPRPKDGEITKQAATSLKVIAHERRLLPEMNPDVYLAEADRLEYEQDKPASVSIINQGLERYQQNNALLQRLAELRPRVSANRGSGTYSGKQTVALTADAGADIYYAYGGGNPTTKYSSGIYLGYGTTTLRAVAHYPELEGDAINLTYTILPPPPNLPKHNSSMGDSLLIRIYELDTSLTVYYNIDGGTPTIYDEEYDHRLGIELYSSSVINAISVTDNGLVSQVSSQSYEILTVPEEYQSMVNMVRSENRGKLLTLIDENPDIMSYYEAVQSGMLADPDLMDRAETYRSIGMKVFYLPSSNTVKGYY